MIPLTQTFKDLPPAYDPEIFTETKAVEPPFEG
jgi:hypothetical protein